MLKSHLICYDFQSKKQPQIFFRYSFCFASIIPPFISQDITIFNHLHYKAFSKKTLIKRSYLILTWLYHLSCNKTLTNSKNDKPYIKFSILPSRTKTYTLTKAPIAHKKNSKEQFQFRFYFFKITFRSISTNIHHINSIEGGYIFFLSIKNQVPAFETNLMFLKYSVIQIPVSDNKYFSYYEHERNGIY